MSTDCLADSKAAGERVEHRVIDRVDELEPVADRDAHVDARATTAISPRDELPFASICVVERDTDVEIKSAMVVISRTSSTQQRGRFYFRRDQHEHLLEVNGVYCCAVTTPDPQRELLALKIVPAAIVEDLRNDWKTPDGRPAYDQLGWTNLFQPEEVEGGESA